MEKPSRIEFIDILRGLSVAAVINLHSLANYLSNKYIVNLWDIQQFAVQMFVFCSAYLYFSRPDTLNRHTFFAYFKKRLARLYVPYFAFLCIFFGFVFLLAPQTFNWEEIFKAVFVIGGIDINWLVLLFIQLAFIFPFIRYIHGRNKLLFYAYILFVVYTAGFLFFAKFPFNWKWIMWLPWSFMGLYAIFYIHFEKNEEVINLSYLYFAVLFIMFECMQYVWRGSIAIYPNKYPPNLLILSYGVIWMGIVQFLHKIGFFHAIHAMRFITFLSKYSYQLFFVHFVIIFIMNQFHLNVMWPWYVYWIVLFTSTLILQKLILMTYSFLNISYRA
jgi:peptidoglycan/LPS O-acetylase OafA/YrhL